MNRCPTNWHFLATAGVCLETVIWSYARSRLGCSPCIVPSAPELGPFEYGLVRPDALHCHSCTDGALCCAGRSASLPFSDWFDRLDLIRAKLARLIGAEADDIGFCPNAGTGSFVAATWNPLEIRGRDSRCGP